MLDLRVRALSTGVAGRLVETAVRLAAGDGLTRLYYWVGSENARAIGFATGFGFGVTLNRRPAAGGEDAAVGGTEMALILAIEDDPAAVPHAGGLLRRDSVAQPGCR